MDERSGISAQGGYIAKYDYKTIYFIFTVKLKTGKIVDTSNFHRIEFCFWALIVN